MKRKLLVVEINEITWDLIDPMIAQGKLPTFARLKQEGAWGTALSVDMPPQLDPWITWTTLYTGQPQSEHNVYFLQQPPESIHAKRVWERCAEAGLSVGVYGSVCSYPPRPVRGFYIPDTFSPDAQTFPEQLSPIQVLNLTYTRSIRLPTDQDTLAFKISLGARLLSLGLRPQTIATIVSQLAHERMNPVCRWKRAALQPEVNLDFFATLYRKHRPDFASFHTNHVAHYMHTYWKAMDPSAFMPLETSQQERDSFGGAIEHGYVVADRLLSRVLKLVDSDTVLAVLSSMGQKPYKAALKGGKQICQWRSLPALLDILGVKSKATAISTMSDEFVIYSDAPDIRERILQALNASYIDRPEQKTFICSAVQRGIRVNLVAHERDAVKPASNVYFPGAPGSPVKRYEDVIYNTGHLKSGCHDPRGVMVFCGAGVPQGLHLPECNNLALAPTLMGILGLPIPSVMKAEPIREIAPEAVREAPAVQRA